MKLWQADKVGTVTDTFLKWQISQTLIWHFKYHIISCHIISYHITSHHIISYHIVSHDTPGSHEFRTPSYVANYTTPVSVSEKNKRGTGWHPHDPKAIQQHEEGRQCKGVPPRGVTRSNRSQVITNQTFKKSIPNDFDCVLLELNFQVENSSSVNPFKRSEVVSYRSRKRHKHYLGNGETVPNMGEWTLWFK